MNLNQFITKYEGKYVEIAGSANAKNQCVDLANAYIRFVLGLPIIEWTDAKDFPKKAGDKYDYILNKGLIVPEVGDLVIWSTNHIAICTYSDINTPWFTSFDQNWPTGSACHKVDHNYNNVAGWLHPKGDNTSDNQELDKLRKQVSDLQAEVEYKNGQIASYDNQVKGLVIEIKEEQDARKRDLQAIAEKLGISDDLVEILKEVEKLIVAEEGLTDCLKDKRECEQNSTQKATELREVYENLKLLSGYSVASPKGVENALKAFAKLNQTEVVGDIKDFNNIIKLAGAILWQK